MAEQQRPLLDKDVKVAAEVDPELRAMRQIVRLLERLSEDARRRIVAYLAGRYETRAPN